MRQFTRRAGGFCHQCAANGFASRYRSSSNRIAADFSNVAGLRSAAFELHRMQIGKDGADKNLRLSVKRNPVRIVRNPDRRTTEFPVRFQLEIFAQALKLEISLDGIVSAGVARDLFAAEHSYGRKVSRSGWIHDDSINAVIFQRLAS